MLLCYYVLLCEIVIVFYEYFFHINCNQVFVLRCRCTAAPDKCSSRGLPLKRAPGEGILSPDPQINPHFYNWNKVELHYCTSDVYQGNGSQTSQEGKLIFRGSHTVVALHKHMVKVHELSRASQVILAGDSAGAYGVIDQRRYLGELLPDVKLYCLVDSGYIYLRELININGCNDALNQTHHTQSIFWTNPKVSRIAYHRWWLDVTVPTYFVINRWDSIDAALHCIDIKKQKRDELEAFSNAMLKRIGQIQASSEKIGLFVPGCTGHGLLNSNDDFTRIKVGVQGVTLSENLWSWINSHYSKSEQYTSAVDDCEISPGSSTTDCNPTCLRRNFTDSTRFFSNSQLKSAPKIK